MSIRKTPLQQAIIEAKEIEKVAYESAKKAMEETLSPKIEQAVKESLMELEKTESTVIAEEPATVVEDKKNVEEGVKIEVTPDGAVTVTKGEEAGEASIEVVQPEINAGSNVEDIPNTENTDDMNNMEEEIYEVEAGAPADVSAEVPTETPAEAPAEMPMEAPVSENPFEVLNQKLDAILNKVGTEQAPSQGAEGEVEIVDDEAAGEPVASPAPVGASPEVPMAEVGGMEDEEVVYELADDEGYVRETDAMFNEMNDLEEIEIVDEDKEEIPGEEMEEMTGLSHSVQNRQPNRQHKNPQGHHAPVMPLMKEGKDEKKVQAHNESKMDELKQENEGLKKTIKEYKESFLVLRKQINEVQVFNAKLAYANKLFINGGLKNEEKVRIVEEFDKVSTVEDAKKLYNSLVKEVSEVKSVKTTPEEKLMSVKPSVVQPQAEQSQTLYESTEIKRMKQLAGIINEAREF